MMPKEERKTHFGRKFHARPNLGWKLFQSPLDSGPLGCVMAPINPVSGSATLGLNSDCCPYLALKGDSYDHRRPRFRVKPRIGFQSSCTYKELCHQRGSQVARF